MIIAEVHGIALGIESTAGRNETNAKSVSLMNLLLKVIHWNVID